MKQVNIDIKAAAFPDQFVSDSEKNKLREMLTKVFR